MTMTQSPVDPATSRDGHPWLSPPRHRIDRLAAWVADASSPILVKEYRQAIKSRQFLWTFMTLLFAVLVWSYWGVSTAMAYEHDDAAFQVLAGYLWILGFPLIVVVPYAAFRSLAREFEEDTIQLVGITSMQPRQIIMGKLLSAWLQLAVYLFVMTPCMAFTYLLQGVDLLDIGLAVGILLVTSVAATCLGMMCAGLARNAFARMVINLVLLIAVLIVYWMTCAFASLICVGNIEFVQSVKMNTTMMFWLVTLSCGFLFYESAGAQVSFPSSNRSSAVRYAMLVCHACLLCAVLISANLSALGVYQTVVMFLILSGHYWVILGSTIVAERGLISARVRRTLPQGSLAKTFFSLFFPGPGRGYLFVLTQLCGWPIVVSFTLVGIDWLGNLYRWPWYQDLNWTVRTFDLLEMAFVNAVIALGYLSAVFLICLWLRRRLGRDMAPIVGLIVCIVLYTAITTASYSLHVMLGPLIKPDFRNIPLFTVGVWVSLFDAASQEVSVLASSTFPAFNFVLLAAFLLLTLFAVVIASRELQLTRVATPDRVLEEPQGPPKRTDETESFEQIIASR